MPQMLWFFIAFLIVLALIGLAAWLVRRFGGSGLGANAGRGRMPRLAVIDAAAVDGRRRLVLVRRDNVEHLLMIGGPTDIVVEPNIIRAPQRDQAQVRSPAGTELPPPPRVVPESSWPDTDMPRAESLDHREPPPELPVRPVRAPYADDTRRPAPPPIATERPAADPLTSFTPDSSLRPETPARSIPRSERAEPLPPRLPRSELPPKAPPPVRPQPRPADSTILSADQNLADMAQRLEAALRRPVSEVRADVTEPRTPPAAPPVAVEPASRPVPRPESLPPRNVAPSTPPSSQPSPAAPKAPFENLEDEMASLLGRSKPPA